MLGNFELAPATVLLMNLAMARLINSSRLHLLHTAKQFGLIDNTLHLPALFPPYPSPAWSVNHSLNPPYPTSTTEAPVEHLI